MAKKGKLRRKKSRAKKVRYARQVAKRNTIAYDRDMKLAGYSWSPTQSRARKTRQYKLQMKFLR